MLDGVVDAGLAGGGIRRDADHDLAALGRIGIGGIGFQGGLLAVDVDAAPFSLDLDIHGAAGAEVGHSRRNAASMGGDGQGDDGQQS